MKCQAPRTNKTVPELSRGFGNSILSEAGWSSSFKKTEPQVKQKRDRNGNSYWQIYDPKSGRSTSFASELEVRIWLEKRHHCR